MPEFQQAAELSGRAVNGVPYFVPGAFHALNESNQAAHDAAIAQMTARAKGCDRICFAQFSTTSAAGQAQVCSGLPVLTTPDSAVLALHKLF